MLCALFKVFDYSVITDDEGQFASTHRTSGKQTTHSIGPAVRVCEAGLHDRTHHKLSLSLHSLCHPEVNLKSDRMSINNAFSSAATVPFGLNGTVVSRSRTGV